MQASTPAAQLRLSDFLSFSETCQQLADKLNSANTPTSTQSIAHEIAAWVSLRSLTAYLQTQDASDPDRCGFEPQNPDAPAFGYSPTLQECHFNRQDVASFQPPKRYISGFDLDKRWADACGGEDAARQRHDGYVRQGLLEFMHPLYYPPFNITLFPISQVLAIEAAGFSATASMVETADLSSGEQGMIAATAEPPISGNDGAADTPRKRRVTNTVSLLAQVIAAKQGISSETAMPALLSKGDKVYPPKTCFIGAGGLESFQSGRADVYGEEFLPDVFRARCKEEGITIQDLETAQPDMDFAAYFGKDAYEAMWESVRLDNGSLASARGGEGDKAALGCEAGNQRREDTGSGVTEFDIKRKNEWRDMIVKVIHKYEVAHKEYPSWDQFWLFLYENPPKGVTVFAGVCNPTGKGFKEQPSVKMAGVTKHKSDIKRRFDNLNKNTNKHQ
ncbi:MAG: hypothetical protein ACKN9T_04295 [Candidatus Methylumidiphilus sp.]